MRDIKEEKTTYDLIEYIGKSQIQHGKHNDRIYLMHFHPDDYPGILPRLEELTKTHDYAKIFVKVPSWAAPAFKGAGYILEALIPGFYSNIGEDACFMSKFMNSDRVHFLPRTELENLTELLHARKGVTEVPPLDPQFRLEKLRTEHIDRLSEIYREVFATYPFPIHDPAYLREVMETHVSFYGIFKGDDLAAVSSAERDPMGKNAEMTDFATRKDFRGKKLSLVLLEYMEQQMAATGIRTVYTIARLHSIPMNRTFLGLGYWYGGTLINNTNISGRIESMNVLYKYL